MDDKEFCELCYKQLRDEMSQTDGIYQRCGILLAILPIMGVAAYRLGRPDLVTKVFTRVDIFLYLLATAAAFLSLAVSAGFLIWCVVPRSSYSSPATMKEWAKWRDQHRSEVRADGNRSPAETEEVVSDATVHAMIERLTDAEERCAPINEKRRRAFRWSIMFAGITFACIGTQALFHLLLFLQGV